MKRSRYTPEQIAFTLRQAENGTPVVDVCRKMGIAEQTFYRWKKRFVGMAVADLSLDKQMLQALLPSKFAHRQCLSVNYGFGWSRQSHSSRRLSN